MKNKYMRLTVAVSVPLILSLGAYYLYKYGNPFPCLFYTFTGLYCFGCGSGRAAREILHLHIIEAAGYNLLFVVFLPLVAYFLLQLYLNYISGKKVLKPLKLPSYSGYIFSAVFIAFVIARNIPLYPLTVLAP